MQHRLPFDLRNMAKQAVDLVISFVTGGPLFPAKVGFMWGSLRRRTWDDAGDEQEAV